MNALPANFLAKTKPADCIVWTGALNSRGYPCFAVGGVSQLAHRVAYEAHHGTIPDGLTVDHLCGFRRCVNPQHLEAVPRGENNRRATSAAELCVNGHPLVDLGRKDGKRGCRTCSDELVRAHRDAHTFGAGGASARQVRAWAVAQGYNVSPRGNLPTAVRAAYLAAHQEVA